MLDDFDPIDEVDDLDNEQQDLNNLNQVEYTPQNTTSLREKVDNLKEKKEKAQNIYDKYQNRKNGINNPIKSNAKDSAKSKAKNIAKNKAGDAAKDAASKAGKNAIREGSKKAVKTGAKTAAKVGVKGAAAAGTAGASVAVDAAAEAVKVVGKQQKKMLAKFDKVTGLNLEKHRHAINLLTIVMLPLACCFCVFMLCGTLGSVSMMNDSLVDTTARVIDETLAEANEGKTEDEKMTLLTIDIPTQKKLKKNLYDAYRDVDSGLPEVIENIESSEEEEEKDKEEDLDIFTVGENEKKDSIFDKGHANHVAKNFTKFIMPYMLTEKANFNRIKWTGWDASKNEEVELKFEEDSEIGLRYPYKIDYNEEDTDIKKLAKELHPYLQQWIIPFAAYLTTPNTDLLKSFRNEMLHEIEIAKIKTYKYVTKNIVVYKVKTETKKEKQEDGTVKEVTVPVRDANGDYVKTVAHTGSIKEVKLLDEVKNYIVKSNTYWGTKSVEIETKARDESTRTESTETSELRDDFTIEEVTTITYKDKVEEKNKELKPYKIWVNGKEEELKEEESETENKTEQEQEVKDKYPQTVRSVYVSNSPAFLEKYNGSSFSMNNMESANEYIKKYHQDAYILEKEGNFVNTVAERDGISFIWPIKDEKAKIIKTWYKEKMFSEDNGLTIVGPKSEGKYEVVAACDGTIKLVMKVNFLDIYYVAIEHRDGYTTLYKNLVNVPEEIKSGKEVKAGEVIGEMGDGEKNESLMKFEIQKLGEVKDPFEFYNYSVEDSSEYKKKVRRFTEVKRTLGGYGSGVVGGPMVMSADWNARVAAMIDEAAAMVNDRALIYSMQLREQPYVDRRQNTYSDCSSFVANLYYRFFDHAQIGTYTVPQYGLQANGINAIAIEDFLDSEDKLRHDVLMPGDLIFQNGGAAGGAGHVMMYVGGYKDYPPGTIVHQHGPRGASGPDFMNFNEAYGQGQRAKHRGHAVRYYRDGDIISQGGGAANLGDIPRGSEANTPFVQGIVSKYKESILKWSSKFGVDPGIVVGMICQESGGNPHAYNGYAKGLMQIEHVHWGQSIKMEFADGTSENHVINEARLYDPDYNIMIGCWEFSTQMKATYGNPLVAIQGYNYGYGGIRRCIGYHVKGGANTGKQFCGMSESEFASYCQSGDTGWLSARQWYTSTGWRIFGGGGGTADHLERVLKYYVEF